MSRIICLLISLMAIWGCHDSNSEKIESTISAMHGKEISIPLDSFQCSIAWDLQSHAIEYQDFQSEKSYFIILACTSACHV